MSSVDGLKLPNSVYLPSGYDPSKAYPMWVDLHALYSQPDINNDTSDPFSNDLKKQADQDGFIIFAPWGRNLHSLFVDGLKKDQSPYLEPSFFDDFSSSANSWTPSGGTWALNAGAYRQSDIAPGWKESVRSGSTGKDYSIRCRVRDLSNASGETAIGVNLRRQTNGDCYHVDLYRDPTGAKFVRLYKVTGGVWQKLFSTEFSWAPLNPFDGWIDLKFSCYQDYLEVYVNENLVNMQPNYDCQAYGYGRKVPGTPVPAGSVSLCSYGGRTSSMKCGCRTSMIRRARRRRLHPERHGEIQDRPDKGLPVRAFAGRARRLHHWAP